MVHKNIFIVSAGDFWVESMTESENGLSLSMTDDGMPGVFTEDQVVVIERYLDCEVQIVTAKPKASSK